MFPAPQCAICAALLPHVMEASLAMRQREPEPAISRYGRDRTPADWKSRERQMLAWNWVRKLVAEFQIPPCDLQRHARAHE